MTLRKVDREQGFSDELDTLLRWALDDRVSQVQPPAYVWERIAGQVRRCALDRSRRRALARLWNEIRRGMWHLVVGQPGWCSSLDAMPRPVMFSIWEGLVPASLVFYFGQPVPALR